MKVISYSIFRAPCEKFEFMAYLRGLYFNVKMNQLIYPGWTTCIHVHTEIMQRYNSFFNGLCDLFDSNKLFLITHTYSDLKLCEGMIWRMEPVFYPQTTHVLCRDADALTSYREAQSVDVWLKSGAAAHIIHDNPAHGGLMGGMVGFKCDAIRKGYRSWEHMIKGYDLSKRGSDQYLLNKRVLPLVQDSLYTADLQAFKPYTNPVNDPPLPGVDKRLWESNLCSAFIGSAGVNEMETLRFFKRFDKTDYSEFEKQHSDICYWARN